MHALSLKKRYTFSIITDDLLIAPVLILMHHLPVAISFHLIDLLSNYPKDGSEGSGDEYTKT